MAEFGIEIRLATVSGHQVAVTEADGAQEFAGALLTSGCGGLCVARLSTVAVDDAGLPGVAGRAVTTAVDAGFTLSLIHI